MKKILRLLILSFLVFSLSALLISCDMLDFSSEEEPCSHRDKNDTGFCDFCYEIYSDGIDVSHTHYFGAWETISLSENDRCEDMEFKRKCLDCDYSETREGKYSDHKFNNTVVDATCTSYGSVKKTCIACGLVEEYDLPLSSHTYGEYVSDASSHWKICSVCGDSTEHSEHTVDKSGYCRSCDCILGVTEGVVYDISVDGTYAEVIKYRGDSRRVIISSEYKGLPVRTVFAEAFYGSDITSVVLPETLYEIGNYAFANCKNLKSIDIGDNVISIGNYAFNSCENLEFVTFGEGLTTIGISAFCKCKSIETVTLSDNVESIGNYAFSECTNLKYVTIDNGIKSIGDAAFKKCKSLLSVSINGDLEVIGKECFYDCNLLYQFEIPLTVVNIGEAAFYNCDGLYSIVIPDGVKIIYKNTFYSCSELSSVTLSKGVISVGENAFFGCANELYTEYEYAIYVGDKSNPYSILIDLEYNNLTTYEINENTEVIAFGAFSGSPRLTNLTIPKSVRAISEKAFYSCANLTNITISQNVQYIGRYAFSLCNDDCSVYYSGAAESWANLVIDAYNYDFTSFKRYYYSETEPAETGNYWHYDENGKIAVW